MHDLRVHAMAAAVTSTDVVYTYNIVANIIYLTRSTFYIYTLPVGIVCVYNIMTLRYWPSVRPRNTGFSTVGTRAARVKYDKISASSRTCDEKKYRKK